MNPDWIQVRLRRSTHARVVRIAKARHEAYMAGRMEHGEADGPESIDAVVSYLASMWESRQARDRASRSRKRKRPGDGHPA